MKQSGSWQTFCHRTDSKYFRHYWPHMQSYILFFFFLINLFYLFIFGCVGFSLLHVGFLQLRRAGATHCCSARASHCGGFSRCGARALGTWASIVAARGLSSCGSRALEHRLSSCGARAQLLRGTWDLPRPGLQPLSPALAGGFLTTAPPGKPTIFFLLLFLQLFKNVKAILILQVYKKGCRLQFVHL